MTLRLIDADELESLLSLEDAIEAIHRVYARDALPSTPERGHVGIDAGELLLMPSGAPDLGVGVKLVSLAPGNAARGLPFIQGLYVLFERDTLTPAALIDGAALTALRTAAVSAFATRCLARDESRRLVIFGAGVQARAHLDAMSAVRPIEHVTVVGRSPDNAEKLAAYARERGLDAVLGDAGAVESADIVCTCTTSTTPLFDGEKLARGVHVNAVGAYQPSARELDDVTIKCGWVVVETRQAALAEAGDLLIPIGAGVIEPGDISADLSELARGAQIRMSDDDITVFKSVGVAFEDLAVAAALADRIR